MHSLPLFHRITGMEIVVVGEGDAATAKRRLIERAGGRCCDEDQAVSARIAFVAQDDPVAAAATAARLKERGLSVNVADQPALCDFTLPSLLERGDVLVAVSTGGASAGLAKHLRLRLEALLPASLGDLAQALASARARIRSRWPEPGERRRAIDAALAEGGPLDPFRGAGGDRVDVWLSEGDGAVAVDPVEIALTSDDPDDLTLRQARLLGAADVVIHDRDVPQEILARLRADAIRLHPGAQLRPGAEAVVILRRVSPARTR